MLNILVIGGAGFIGSHVADALSMRGHRVTIFGPQSSPYLRADQTMMVGDVLDANAVAMAVKGMDVVYHFASVADIKEASEDPVAVTQVNVLGTVHVLEACRQQGVARIILASSVYVYSHVGSIYRASKQAAERFVEAYAERFGRPSYTIARVGTVYGPRAQEWNGLRQLITEAVTQNRICYKGSGEEMREFIHVFDAAESFADLLDDAYVNAHVIITGQQSIRARDFTAMITEMCGGKMLVSFEHEGAQRPDHYTVTPYSYRPKMAKRLSRSNYIDLGQGILEYLHELQLEKNGVDYTGIPQL